MHTETEILRQDIRIPHNINVANFLHSKLINHIQILKNYESRSITSQTWIANAIKKKLERAEKFPEKELPRKKTLFVKIDPKSLEKISEQVEILKKRNGSYSKTKWIVDAIMDQLEEEYEKARELLKK